MKYRVYTDASGEWRWNLSDTHNRIIATSAEGYRAKDDCLRAIELIRGTNTSGVNANFSEPQSERQYSNALSESKRALSVFLCHSSGDKLAVRALYNRLRAAADYIAPWLDEEDLLPGQKWEDEIPAAVRNSDVVLVCLSNESINKSGYVQKEIKDALDVADRQPEGTIFLIPAKLEECRIPDRLRHLQWVNVFEEKGFRLLLRALTARAENFGLSESGDRHTDKQLEKPTSAGLLGNVIAAEAKYEIKRRRAGKVTILDMSGRVTIGEGSVALRNSIRNLLKEGKKDILLNFEGVRYMDSSGVGELDAANKLLKREGGQLKLLNLTLKFQDLLVITKLLTVFDVFDDEATALKSFK